MVPSSILAAYHFENTEPIVTPFGSGLINHTWKVKDGNDEYILQRINDAVFKQPTDIAANIDMIGDYLSIHSPEYYFVKPVVSRNGQTVEYLAGDGYYRLFPFVNGSHAKNVLENAAQAYEASAQFGKFTKLLSGFDVSQLKTTLPQFHDLSYRYHEFKQALTHGNISRIKESEALIAFIKSHYHIVTTFELIGENPQFKQRVTHHDTKISNVLFDKNDKALCVIDLDTVMPGYFISDIGDMLRTYLPPVSEEEQDLSKILVRDEMYTAIIQGYSNEMNGELTAAERKHFFYAGEFMIYMQALRFLTDHLNNDQYYGAKYPGHNFVRANNQATLLTRFLEKKNLYSQA